ncbi:unnamed protein product [Notodromas monacha]|uniref:Large subunit GTPase 1 homolog n=1 Tax=Notodromas monacha TaxID=399045 RepID=A0A7R9BZQ7_9CRUS|nr:unnamed protein product [Notodromas monacha]CAG0924767.1 unnamed protein product [Notodromas monacha]
MPKQPKKSNLGRALVKDKFSKKRHDRGESMLHAAELKDGADWNRLNLRSVTESNNLDEFLATAELAGTDFKAARLNMTFIPPSSKIGVLSSEEKAQLAQKHEEMASCLRIPRRPAWDASTTPEELDMLERESFLEWRRRLAEIESGPDGVILTPFEKNLEFWRQLWRVVERSHVVVQIVDARNPLLFRCKDLERYVKEVDSKKQNVILVNKADFLTRKQRDAWANYFAEQGLKAIFFSATKDVEEDQSVFKL